MASSENQLTIHFMHDVPEYLEQTAALISEEWPRGMNARYDLLAVRAFFPGQWILLHLTIRSNSNICYALSYQATESEEL